MRLVGHSDEYRALSKCGRMAGENLEVESIRLLLHDMLAAQVPTFAHRRSIHILEVQSHDNF